MKRAAVLLMVPPQEYGYGYINDFFWQEGLLYLASFLKKRFGADVDVQICDGNHRSLDECRDVLRAKRYDLVGFHAIDHTRTAALELARLAVDGGCRRILFGGAGAIFGAAQYLDALGDLDEDVLIGACSDAGEYTVEAALTGVSPAEIPNLVYRIGSGDRARTKRSRVVRGRPGPEEYLDLPPYELYPEIFGYLTVQLDRADYPYRAPTYSGLSHEGCPHRVYRSDQLIRGCSFCAIPAQKMTPRSPEDFWRRFGELDRLSRQRLGEPLRSIKDWGDSLTPKLLGRLIKARPDRFAGTTYSGYLSVADMTPTMLDTLVEMNTWSIYMGLDGTSDVGLDFLEKGYSTEKFWERLGLLKSGYDFRIEMGIILGVRGETRQTLTHSVRTVRRIRDMFGARVIVIQGNVLVPMPGSFVFHSLSDAARQDGLEDPLRMDVQGRIRLWVDNFTAVSFDDCAAAQGEIERISPRRHSYALASPAPAWPLTAAGTR
jgi:radical SAM superfamily enzyme YgiQ (UPF0313 family)